MMGLAILGPDHSTQACWTFYVAPHNSLPALKKFAFGSCNRQYRDQSLWDPISKEDPDLWVWLGDVVYTDQWQFPKRVPSPLPYVREQYRIQKESDEYREFASKHPIIGVWDDHDYGMNNGGSEYDGRDDVQQIFLDFLDEPSDSSRRKQKGVYESYTFGPPGKQVKFLMMDGRYHMSAEDVLGADQWAWLEKELLNSEAQVHIFSTGIQVISDDKITISPAGENWTKYNSKQRLIDLMVKHQVPGALILTGDVHFSEVCVLHCTGLGYPLYDITSSGMTHSWETQIGNVPLAYYLLANVAPDRFIVSQEHRYLGMNFGTLTFDFDTSPISALAEVHDTNGTVRYSLPIQFTPTGSRSESCTPERRLAESAPIPEHQMRRHDILKGVGTVIGYDIDRHYGFFTFSVFFVFCWAWFVYILTPTFNFFFGNCGCSGRQKRRVKNARVDDTSSEKKTN